MNCGITATFHDHARARGDQPALIFDATILSWRELVGCVDALAQTIARRTPPEGRIALALPQSPALALLFLACAHAGREAQILDSTWPPALLASTIAELKPDLVVHATDAPDTSRPALVIVDPFAVSTLVEQVGGAENDGETYPVDDDALFYCGLTSGSTGLPRAYRRTHRSWLESFRADAAEFNIGAHDVVLAPGSLTHSLFVYALAHGLYIGASVVMCARFHPPDVVRLARQHRASVLYGVPSQAQLLAEWAQLRDEAPLSDLRWVLVTGAKWFRRDDPSLRALMPRACFVEFYGASETSFITLARDDEAVPQGSVGRAFAGVKITIRDAGLKPVPTREEGLVFIESAMLFHSYATDTADDIIRAGHAICVGDIGHLDGGGFLFLTGRQKRMIVSSGKNLYPEEVEAVLRNHAAIDEALVIGAPDALRGEKLVALVHVRGDVMPSRRELIGHARARLPLFKVPRVFARVAEWPRTHSGKTDAQALHAMWQSGTFEVLI